MKMTKVITLTKEELAAAVAAYVASETMESPNEEAHVVVGPEGATITWEEEL